MELVGTSSPERPPEASDVLPTAKLNDNLPILPQDVSVLSLVDFRYTSGTCAASFYLRYRDRFAACLAKRGERRPEDGNCLDEDERLGPAGEDLLLLHVLGLIDRRLPAHVRDLYSPRLGDSRSRRLVDFRYQYRTCTVPYCQSVEVFLFFDSFSIFSFKFILGDKLTSICSMLLFMTNIFFKRFLGGLECVDHSFAYGVSPILYV
jgi:hypothetical protein